MPKKYHYIVFTNDYFEIEENESRSCLDDIIFIQGSIKCNTKHGL